MIWDHVGLNPDKYNECKTCNECPAFGTYKQVLGSDDYEKNPYLLRNLIILEEGPYCRGHWLAFIDDLFDKLQEELDNEDWGSMPETKEETRIHSCPSCPNEIDYDDLEWEEYGPPPKRDIR